MATRYTANVKMPNFLSRLFGGGREKGMNLAEWTPVSGGGAPVLGVANGDRNWVFVAVDKVGKACAAVRLKAMRYENGDDTEIYEGPLAEFLATPTNGFTGRSWVKLHVAYLQLAGNAFWEIRQRKQGKLILVPLNPSRVRPLVENDELLGYEVYTGNTKRTLRPDQVLHDRVMSAASPFWGLAPLDRIAAWAQTDFSATEWNRVFFERGASFGGFLETDSESLERIKLIRAGMVDQHAGLHNAHKLGVLPKGVKVSKSNASMAEMQFQELDERYADKILAAFGVPKSVLGLSKDVNRANAEAGEYVFSKYTVKPVIEDLVDFLNASVVPLLDPSGKTYVAYEEFVPEDKAAKTELLKVATAGAAFMTTNEARAELGLPPLADGDALPEAAAPAPVGKMAARNVPYRARIASNVHSDPFGAAAGGVAKLLLPAVTVAAKEADVSPDEAAHRAFAARVDAYEERTAEAMRTFNGDQQREVVRNLKRIVEGAKALKKADVLDVPGQTAILIDVVTPIFGPLYREQLDKEWEEQGFEGSPEEGFVTAAIEREAARFAASYNDTTADLLKVAIQAGISEGESISDIAERVSQVYRFSDEVRALMVARTETFTVANEATRDAYIQSGVVETVRWYTADNERTCQFCRPMNEKVIGVKESWYGKGDVAQGDEGGTMALDYRAITVPPLHPNCRCFIRAEKISVKAVPPVVVEKVVEREVVREVEDEAFLGEIADALNANQR